MHNLESELKIKYQSIWVERQGILPDSYMITKSIINEIEPKKQYQILEKSIKEITKDENNEKPSPCVPKNIIINGIWNNEIRLSFSDSNILGDNGVFTTNKDYMIPIAKTTPENLAFYGASLHQIGDTISFDTSQTLPVTIVEVGENYVDGYIYPIAKGIYCEKHNTPHYHQPISPDSSGYLVIGKEVEEGLQLSAFQIPYGCGIYMAPNTIHNDLFLKGQYMVVYAKAEEYSTVLFRRQDNVPVKIGIIS